MHKLRLILLIALIWGALPPLPAHADEEEPQTAEEYRERLLRKGIGEDSWNGLWVSMLNRGNPKQLVTDTLGLVIDPDGILDADEEMSEQHAEDFLTWAISRLLDRAPTDEPWLAREILARLAKDVAIARRAKAKLVRTPTTDEKAGWLALRRYAERLLEENGISDAVREQCIVILSTLADGRSAESVVILKPHAQKWIGAPGKLKADVFLDAFERLLLRRFESVKLAVTWLQQPPQSELLKKRGDWEQSSVLRWRAYVQLLEYASKVPSKHEQGMIRYGKRAIDAVTEPQGLMEYLNPESTPHVALRQHAINRARQLKPDATKPAWIDLVTQVLLRETAPSVFTGLLDILKSDASFATRNDLSPRLVAQILERLANSVAYDDIRNRKRLVNTLTAIGTSGDIEKALADVQIQVTGDELTEQVAIYEQLLQKYGEIDGAQVTVVAKHYFGGAGAAELVSVRQMAAEALGKSEIRKTQAPAAAALLRLLLSGVGEGGAPAALAGVDVPADAKAETEATVRAAVFSSLQHYPEQETLDLFVVTAAGTDAKEATAAVAHLGRIYAQDDVHRSAAAKALVAVFGAEKAPSDAILQAVLAALGSLPADKNGEARTDALTLTRGVLDPEAAAKRSDAVRRSAAAASLALKDDDPKMLRSIFATWDTAEDETLRGAWAKILDTHLATLAKVEAHPHDANIQAFLKGLQAGSAKQVDEGIRVATTLKDASARPVTWYWLGSQLWARAKLEGREQALVLEDLKQAVVAFGGALKAESADTDADRSAVLNAHNGRYEVTIQLAGLSTGDDRKNYLFKAAEIAKDSGNPGLAEKALGEAGPLAKLTDDIGLTDAEKQSRNTLKTELEQLAKSAG